jgi:hypothetical protein
MTLNQMKIIVKAAELACRSIRSAWGENPVSPPARFDLQVTLTLEDGSRIISSPAGVFPAESHVFEVYPAVDPKVRFERDLDI